MAARRASTPRKKDLETLRQILEFARAAHAAVGDLTFEEWLEADHLRDATMHRIMKIGEATKRLSKELRKKYPDIPWKQMAGMKDVLVHDYDTVDENIVFETASEHLANLIERLEVIVAEEM